MVQEFISQYGFQMIYTALMAFFGFIGIAVKNIIQKHTDDKTKKEVARTTVLATEQVYKDLTGTERFEIAVENASEVLTQKGIACTELELKLLIEAAVKEMNSNIAKVETAVAPKSKSKSKTEAK